MLRRTCSNRRACRCFPALALMFAIAVCAAQALKAQTSQAQTGQGQTGQGQAGQGQAEQGQAFQGRAGQGRGQRSQAQNPAPASPAPAVAQAALTPEEEAQRLNGPPSISLSPALISVKAKAGQAFSQDLTLWNNTNLKLAFQLEARDVVIREGKRVFLPAGEIEGSIAKYAMFNASTVTVLPGAYVTVSVTVTVPTTPGPRAIVCMFLGKTVVSSRRTVAMTGSMGTLITFTLADDLHIQSAPLQVSIDGDARSVTFHQGLTNVGTDPIIPKGVMAVTNESGALVAQLPVDGQRLLPGESLEVTAEHAGLFKTGKYRVMCLMENESSFLANAARFTIK